MTAITTYRLRIPSISRAWIIVIAASPDEAYRHTLAVLDNPEHDNRALWEIEEGEG
jgi:uncharacterized protein (DUF1778 family)